MVFSYEDKIIIQNDYEEKSWSAYKRWRRTVSVEEIMDLIEELICSQEERPHMGLATRKIAKQTGISRSSIQRMVKK